MLPSVRVCGVYTYRRIKLGRRARLGSNAIFTGVHCIGPASYLEATMDVYIAQKTVVRAGLAFLQVSRETNGSNYSQMAFAVG